MTTDHGISLDKTPRLLDLKWQNMPNDTENPYLTPSVDVIPRPAHGKVIRDVRPRCNLMLGAMAVTILMNVALLLGVSLFGTWFTHTPRARAIAPEQWCAILSALGTLSYSTFFFVWIFRSAHNAKILGSRLDDISPGMAVGSFFIPFYNLV